MTKRWSAKKADQINPDLRNLYLIKGWLPAISVVQVVGDSNVGKTAVVMDMVCHIATGRSWRGRRTRQANVLYFAAENPDSVERRIVGWCQHYGASRNELGLYVAAGTIDLRSQADIDSIIQWAHEHGGLGVLVLDTQSFVIGGADENSAGEMNAVLVAATRIRTELRCTVVLVHHVSRRAPKGKGRSNTLDGRGSCAQRGAVDATIGVTENEIGIGKNRDGRKGETMSNARVEVCIGHDADNDQVMTIVAVANPDEHTNATSDGEVSGSGKLSRDSELALRCLLKLSTHSSSVEESAWRNAFYEATTDRTQGAREKAFSRAKDALINSARVHEHGGKRFGVRPPSSSDFSADTNAGDAAAHEKSEVRMPPEPDTRQMSAVLSVCPARQPDNPDTHL